jgi:hypothetical protein
VQAKSWFVWWSKYIDRDLPVEAVYTFYPAGQIVVQVRVKRMGSSPMHWSREYGPHLFVAAPKKAEANPAFVFTTPKVAQIKDGYVQQSEELVLAASDKIKTTFLLTIPAEADKVFDCHMRHDGRSVGWDRSGYGSKSIVMQPGYDSTWACLIQMGTTGGRRIPELRTPKDALPYAMQYRKPIAVEIKGAAIVADDPGDFNGDGFNESEGCFVLRGKGPVELNYRKGQAAGFAPSFKIIGWQGAAPTGVKADGRELPVIAHVVTGNLIFQVQGSLERPEGKLKIGK